MARDRYVTLAVHKLIAGLFHQQVWSQRLICLKCVCYVKQFGFAAHIFYLKRFIIQYQL